MEPKEEQTESPELEVTFSDDDLSSLDILLNHSEISDLLMLSDDTNIAASNHNKGSGEERRQDLAGNLRDAGGCGGGLRPHRLQAARLARAAQLPAPNRLKHAGAA
nr:ethylene-responsive transcription factor 13-like [Ipomoea batatas]GMD34841.1 ethylene-responsive transcription factor 13-like [Ipomoea batatas]